MRAGAVLVSTALLAAGALASTVSGQDLQADLCASPSGVAPPDWAGRRHHDRA
jgi:hypothetical protein